VTRGCTVGHSRRRSVLDATSDRLTLCFSVPASHAIFYRKNFSQDTEQIIIKMNCCTCRQGSSLVQAYFVSVGKYCRSTLWRLINEIYYHCSCANRDWTFFVTKNWLLLRTGS